MKLYDKYDYEDEFDKILHEEDEDAKHIDAIMRGSKKSLLLTKTIKHGNQLDSEIYPAFFFPRDLPRGNHKERSTQFMRDLNDRNAKKTAVRVININFTRNDLWAEFGYDNKYLPKDEEQAQRDIQNFFKRLNYHRKKEGLPLLRYFYVTEYEDMDGNPVRAHHHVIMSGDMDRDFVESQWKKCKRKYTRRVEPDDFGLKGMALYITKVRHVKNGRYIKRWGASKGLKQPKPTKSYKRFSRKKVKEMVEDRNRMKETFERAYPGYIFQSCEVRYNDINGGVYLYAQLRRMPPKESRCRPTSHKKGSG